VSGKRRDAHRTRGGGTVRSLHRLLALGGAFALGVLGIRGRIVVSGVVYRERSSGPLGGIFGERRPGSKQYDVRFPSGERMRIRVTPERPYPDLTGPRFPESARILESIVRPGSRVLELGCARGHTAAWLGVCVGPSGAVVALDPDNESIRFARRRHPANNIAFEVGTIGHVAGELDGAFDGVVVTASQNLISEDKGSDRARTEAQELWRLTRTGGWLLVDRALASEIGRLDQSRAEGRPLAQPTPVGTLVLVRKSGPGGG